MVDASCSKIKYEPSTTWMREDVSRLIDQCVSQADGMIYVLIWKETMRMRDSRTSLETRKSTAGRISGYLTLEPIGMPQINSNIVWY